MDASGVAYWSFAARETRRSWAEALAPKALAPNVASGVSTALVAIPLNVALALACGLPASVGLWTGAVAGIVGALLGGAKLQITGPEVALAPMTLAIVTEHGVDGLLWCTALAGAMQIVFAVARIGRFARATPAPVVLGFMVAVGIMVIDAQLPKLLGMPETVRSMSGGGGYHLGAIAPAAAGIGLLVAVITAGLPKLAKRAPAPLVALAAAVGATVLFGLDVPRVPDVGALLPSIGLPLLELDRVVAFLPSALALALLASLDSLLSAVSVDARLGTRHRSDQELGAQGVANLVSGFVGGMPVAGAIVRSVAAIEAGGTSRLAALVQSVALGAVLLVLGSTLHYLPVAALAAILIVVGVRLLQPTAVMSLYRRSKADVAIAGVTVVAILGLDFVVGVAVGTGAALLRMALSHARPRIEREHEDLEADAALIRIEGPLHFASHDAIERALGGTAVGTVILDLTRVPAIDMTAADAMRRALSECARHGVAVWLRGVRPRVREELVRANAGAWLADDDSVERDVAVRPPARAPRPEAQPALLTIRPTDGRAT